MKKHISKHQNKSSGGGENFTVIHDTEQAGAA